MKTYLITWKTEDAKKISEYLGNEQIIVTESGEEDAILKGSMLIMEIIAKTKKVRCESTMEDDGIRIIILENNKNRQIAEIHNLRAREIWEV